MTGRQVSDHPQDRSSFFQALVIARHAMLAPIRQWQVFLPLVFLVLVMHIAANSIVSAIPFPGFLPGPLRAKLPVELEAFLVHLVFLFPWYRRLSLSTARSRKHLRDWPYVTFAKWFILLFILLAALKAVLGTFQGFVLPAPQDIDAYLTQSAVAQVLRQLPSLGFFVILLFVTMRLSLGLPENAHGRDFSIIRAWRLTGPHWRVVLWLSLHYLVLAGLILPILFQAVEYAIFRPLLMMNQDMVSAIYDAWGLQWARVQAITTVAILAAAVCYLSAIAQKHERLETK